ncbi:glycosyl transferase family 1 [Candidatus Roizmanbacteria bacterium CG_4_10_14_0_2_um_filter_36_35]|uniref:Glycosyl transferase family 1 n=5 Tax=Candidatus Roizmaniibacteriota TaxID=1752723 RepID=A0A2M7BW60_9BACT|nr:MAG: glycosyl transferase family 1 [Candidatus Roizmanbacteria bacterium CG11_big_fil_rev_8_21_14_0_20_35_14]PIV10812.1 MAG: glycosyl transferase family 1 [Candidatus Roizmanbacteria bacterium CG03_land_8_20_14_0_80_35_26]PIZ68269.1 MAG: glycosyl transferase family 1 [Candidatus Roizmanbacteria bacterium CG_4_10_14_0_2_um_filter_36_35]PJC31435.1 MAG: glycosyl transferase family 1 [Candidatus Roizmanbacteria bacterium CG_4_9_14_0_2_um_filter_36_12]PJE61031.1 MAG: glycosyl transferase family 1
MIKNLEKLLTSKSKEIRVIYLSSYIPRKCGIATYTKNLTNAINLLNPHDLAEIMAVTRPKERINYPWEVKYKIKQEELHTYLEAANYINQSGADIISLQHEYGLYGSQCGEYIIPFVESLKKPLVTTLHSVPDDSNSREGAILKRLIKKSDAVVVMMEKIKEKLVNKYSVTRKKIIVILHGTPDLPFVPTDAYKEKKQLSGRIILGNINLLTPPRGIEYALGAVATIAKKYPNVLYLVIGQTHPVFLQTNGEEYRNFLKKEVRRLKIEKNVRFINKYVSLDELIDWLKTIDFYVTPYLDPQQSASGALAYAVGAGKCCISTPYLYAKEILSNNRGILVPFQNADSIASAVIELWGNQDKKEKISQKAYGYGRLMTWPNIGLKYLDLFKTITFLKE